MSAGVDGKEGWAAANVDRRYDTGPFITDTVSLPLFAT